MLVSLLLDYVLRNPCYTARGGPVPTVGTAKMLSTDLQRVAGAANSHSLLITAWGLVDTDSCRFGPVRSKTVADAPPPLGQADLRRPFSWGAFES